MMITTTNRSIGLKIYNRKRWTVALSDEPSHAGMTGPFSHLLLCLVSRPLQNYRPQDPNTTHSDQSPLLHFSSSTRKNYSLLATLTTHHTTTPLELAVTLPDTVELARRVPPSTAHVVTPISAFARPVTLPSKGPQGTSRCVELTVVGRLVEEDEV